MNRNILVTGGAGYIGSHTVMELIKNGDNVIVYDNLPMGNEFNRPNVDCVRGDIGDYDLVKSTLTENNIDAVVHFAASTYVEESVSEPKKYYMNNIANGIVLLDAILDSGVDKIVFSSSCAVYGAPEKIPIDESEKLSPINPYGRAKLMFEQILGDYDQAYGLKSVRLRYFNAAGADSSGKIGERHDPETHVLPLLIQAVINHRKDFSVFGTDYDTKDGTCIRDYVHVTDLAIAHLKATEYLFQNNRSEYFNLGSGEGTTVMELIRAVEKISGVKLNVRKEERRRGDADTLIADINKANALLNWHPAHSSIDNIVKTAWEWHTGAGRK